MPYPVNVGKKKESGKSFFCVEVEKRAECMENTAFASHLPTGQPCPACAGEAATPPPVGPAAGTGAPAGNPGEGAGQGKGGGGC